jgi:hypothetical protein
MKSKSATPVGSRAIQRTAPGNVVIHCRFKERRRGRSLHVQSKSAGRTKKLCA